ncbi:hypothetical protein GW17_00027486 [Ensete ventricosum]|nr:hypothetical protein GW17_00027486 [Ensete ventricosum]
MDRFAKVSHLIVQQVVPQEMDRKSINEGSMLRHLSKVGTPQLQTRASLQGQQAWWVGTVVRQAPTPYREDREAGELAHTGLNQQMLAQQTWRRDASTRQAPETSLSFLALEGGPMSPERPLTDSGTERQTEPDHPRLAEEVPAAMPTPNRFWRMMTDPGFPSPASNPAPFMVTAEAFLGLTSQVQALAGMVQTIISYLPQLVHSAAHQPAPLQTESPTAPSRGIPPVAEAPPPRVVEAPPPRVAEEPPPRVPVSPAPTPTRSQSRSYNPAPTELDLDTLSTDSTDSLREQVR